MRRGGSFSGFTSGEAHGESGKKPVPALVRRTKKGWVYSPNQGDKKKGKLTADPELTPTRNYTIRSSLIIMETHAAKDYCSPSGTQEYSSTVRRIIWQWGYSGREPLSERVGIKWKSITHLNRSTKSSLNVSRKKGGWEIHAGRRAPSTMSARERAGPGRSAVEMHM